MKSRHRKKILVEMVHSCPGFTAVMETPREAEYNRLVKLGYLVEDGTLMNKRFYKLTDKGIQGVLKK